MELESEQGAGQGQQQLAHKSYPPGIVDAYTHFAPPGLLAFLQQHSEGPLVFAKVRSHPIRPSLVGSPLSQYRYPHDVKINV